MFVLLQLADPLLLPIRRHRHPLPPNAACWGPTSTTVRASLTRWCRIWWSCLGQQVKDHACSTCSWGGTASMRCAPLSLQSRHHHPKAPSLTVAQRHSSPLKA